MFFSISKKLSHFRPVFRFCNCWKTSAYFWFASDFRGLERENWLEIGYLIIMSLSIVIDFGHLLSTEIIQIP